MKRFFFLAKLLQLRKAFAGISKVPLVFLSKTKIKKTKLFYFGAEENKPSDTTYNDFETRQQKASFRRNWRGSPRTLFFCFVAQKLPCFPLPDRKNWSLGSQNVGFLLLVISLSEGHSENVILKKRQNEFFSFYKQFFFNSLFLFLMACVGYRSIRVLLLWDKNFFFFSFERKTRGGGIPGKAFRICNNWKWAPSSNL